MKAACRRCCGLWNSNGNWMFLIENQAITESVMAKVLGWAVLIIFLIGLLVVLGFFKLIIPGD